MFIHHLIYSVMDELVPSNSPRPDPGEKYDSIQGRQLCKKILAKYVTYDPHDYILDGVCPVIDGFNLLATTPTGSGKTGFFTLLMLVVREIAADKTLAIGNEVFPIDPVMIVVCPTKALEEDIVGLVITNDGMLLTLAKATQSREAGLMAIVINSDTVMHRVHVDYFEEWNTMQRQDTYRARNLWKWQIKSSRNWAQGHTAAFGSVCYFGRLMWVLRIR